MTLRTQQVHPWVVPAQTTRGHSERSVPPAVLLVELQNGSMKYLSTYTSLSNLSLLEINIMFSSLMSLCKAAASVAGRCRGQELPQADVASSPSPSSAE